jgi:hypothetical protein
MPFSAKIVIMRHLRKMKFVLLLIQMNLRMPTSTRKLHTDNANVKQLVSTINGRLTQFRLSILPECRIRRGARRCPDGLA